jgi:hypothetical protein
MFMAFPKLLGVPIDHTMPPIIPQCQPEGKTHGEEVLVLGHRVPHPLILFGMMPTLREGQIRDWNLL